MRCSPKMTLTFCYNHRWRTCIWHATLFGMNKTKQKHGCGTLCRTGWGVLSTNKLPWAYWAQTAHGSYNRPLWHVPAAHVLGTYCTSVSLVDKLPRPWNAVKINNLEVNKKYVSFGNFRLSLKALIKENVIQKKRKSLWINCTEKKTQHTRRLMAFTLVFQGNLRF